MPVAPVVPQVDEVSIPFISGQCEIYQYTVKRVKKNWFQSPLYRVNVKYRVILLPNEKKLFQSPLYRVNVK